MYAILDIETTGGNSGFEKITEIAIYIHDGTRIVNEYATLINPEKFVPPFISRLTGITNEMLEDAPRFFEVAKKIVEITEGKIIVGHNVQFDYGFIKEEFRSLGYSFSRDKLCTVKLSRKLLPGHRSYSLGNICQELGIANESRHRAAGDALATVKLFELLLEKNRDGVIENSMLGDQKQMKLPPQIAAEVIHKLPETAGVYYFHNIDGTVIYVGKSKNIRKRVISHFARASTAKAARMSQGTMDITFEETGNELTALLLETCEIKDYQPLFNRTGKRKSLNYGIVQSEDDDGFIHLRPGKIENGQAVVTLANNMEEAKNILARKIQQFTLCQKYCGHDKIDYACFLHQVNLCHGACVGKEDAESYNKRVLSAIRALQPLHDTFVISGRGKHFGEKTIVLVENGNFIGWGYVDPSDEANDFEGLKEKISYKTVHKDCNWIIQQHLRTNGDRGVKMFNRTETVFQPE
jgi:DNA polymerase-3 subunit epsilon